MSSGPSPIYPEDPNYTDTPYVVNFPAMTGDVALSLASLRSLRLNIIQEGPKPNYDVHGHRMNFQDLMDWFDRAIIALTKEAIALQPSDTTIGALR